MGKKPTNIVHQYVFLDQQDGNKNWVKSKIWFIKH